MVSLKRAKYGMRISELTKTRSRKRYDDVEQVCRVINPEGNTAKVVAIYGTIRTGCSCVFGGYFVRIVGPAGNEWLGTHPHCRRKALLNAADAAARGGWAVPVAGTSDEWQESHNSEFGHHPAFDKAVHMLEVLPVRTSHNV